MKTLKDIYNTSSICLAYIPSNIPSPEYNEIIENVGGASRNIIFVPAGAEENFSAIYEDKEFVGTSFDSISDVVENSKLLYKTITVVDFYSKASLFEDVEFLGVDRSIFDSETKAEKAIKDKNFAVFSSLFEGVDQAAIRKVYTAFNPPVKYNSFLKETSEIREQFYTGELYPIGSCVISEETKFEVIDRGSNYLVVVDSAGNTTKKFLEQVHESKERVIFEDFSYFKGFTPSDAFFEQNEIKESFDKTIEDYRSGLVKDPYAILKAIKLVDSHLLGETVDLNQVKYSLSKIGQLHSHSYINEMAVSPDVQLQAAKIIAGAVGCETTGTATEIVNRAILKTKKSTNATQFSILKRMLTTIEKVGVKYDKSLIESVDDKMLSIHKHQKLLKEKPTADVLSAHRDMRKIGVDYEARDIGGKRAMIRDILDHNYGPRDVSSYKALTASIRKTMGESAKNLEELSNDTLHSYNKKAMQDTLSAKKNRNRGMSKAYSRLAGTNKPLLDPKKNYVSETTGYGQQRALEHDYGNEGGIKVEREKPAKYKLVHKATKRVISVHDSAPSAVSARNKIKGTMDSHSIVKENKLDEVHQDPDYRDEVDILGYQNLKKNLAKITGISNYGEQEPGKDIDLVDKDGVVVKDQHSKPGFSLKSQNDTVRKMKVRKLKDE